MREKMDPVRERRARQLGQSRAGVILSPPLPEEGLIGNLGDDRRCRTKTNPPPLIPEPAPRRHPTRSSQTNSG